MDGIFIASADRHLVSGGFDGVKYASRDGAVVIINRAKDAFSNAGSDAPLDLVVSSAADSRIIRVDSDRVTPPAADDCVLGVAQDLVLPAGTDRREMREVIHKVFAPASNRRRVHRPVDRVAAAAGDNG